VPDALLESELFGHSKGSFTGAYRDKPGLFHHANGGTALLDEVGEMSLRMQALLLRFLETGEVQPVGSDRAPDRLDVRIICATHRDLRARIAEGTFREDLFYRLNVIHIHLSPLRERREDIRDLLAAFVVEFTERYRMRAPEFTEAAVESLKAYDWPGNVRELRNVVERLVVSHTTVIDVEDLPLEIRLGPLLQDEEPAAAEPGPAAVARDLVARVLGGESFWDVVYTPFAAHDLTREHLRLVITYGLRQSQGRYSVLTELFNLKKGDYKRFLNVLRKHDCMVPAHAFKNVRAGGEDEPVSPR
jgi:two-component system nitrogen regulation response regulator NtrX